jgi:hypothetical protein
MVRRNGNMQGGKRDYIRVDSGAKHSPPPTTERGKRRAAKRAAEGRK